MGPAGSDARGLGAPTDNVDYTTANTSTPAFSQANHSLIDAVLGRGSYGTMVFRGSFEGRTVAVKRAQLDYVTLISREVHAVQVSRGHPNVMPYYHHETDYDFLYIAQEVCRATLANVFRRPDEFRDVVDALALDPKPALRPITEGLRHLHTLGLIHRDIKPENILLALPGDENENTGFRWLISDFGLRKKYEFNRKASHFDSSVPDMAIHSLGWRAPEVIRQKMEYDDPDVEAQSPDGSDGTSASDSSALGTSTGKVTKSADIFVLGCLYYYVLTQGFHPFGHVLEREACILTNAPEFEGLEEIGEEAREAMTLIKRMLSPDPDSRPDASACLMHPYFWDDGQRMAFLLHAWEPFRTTPRDQDLNRCDFEEGDLEVLGPDRYSRLDELFIEHLDEFRKCDGKSVQDVFNALRLLRVRHVAFLPASVENGTGSDLARCKS